MLTAEEYNNFIDDLSDSEFVHSLSIYECEELEKIVNKYKGENNESL